MPLLIAASPEGGMLKRLSRARFSSFLAALRAASTTVLVYPVDSIREATTV
jgi:hypothetical protein